MKHFHLTILRDGVHFTVFVMTASIPAFLAIEKELGRKTYVLYSREVEKEEYEFAKNHGM